MTNISSSSKIPVKNIYYMLCYAWNVLDQSDNVLLGSESFDNVYNLFARIYINGTSSLLKRGLNRYYVEEKEAVSTLKGKINLTASIKDQSFIHKKAVCQYDDFCEDIKLNQIIKTTINLLLKSQKLDYDLKVKLMKLRLYFSHIKEIRFSKTLFSSLKYHRNNHHYKMLVDISQLIYEGLITNERGNNLSFSDFLRDSQMAKLYEKFVLNFYRIHLNENIYKVHAPKINWQLDEEIKLENLELLPEMRTDIVIENKIDKTQLIIDTKYYSQTLSSSNWSDAEKIRNMHLYQILAYVDNSRFSGEVKGMLLYPTIIREINSEISIRGKSISIKTLNLDQDWKEIEKRLLELVY